MSFNALLSEIRPNQQEIDQVSRSHTYIRDILRSKSQSGLIPPIMNDFLTGSYKRGTKITPLDDVDIFIVFNGQGLQYCNSTITIIDGSNFSQYTSPDGAVSSIKILEAIKRAIPDIYSSIKRDNQCLNIQLSTYGIGLDLVPAFTDDSGNYLIPYGHGKPTWLLTNPQKDEDIINLVNSRPNNLVKDIIRIVKYWNIKKNRQRLKSYHIEAIAMTIFEHYPSILTYLDGLKIYFNQASTYLLQCPDPTRVGGPITSDLDSNQYQLVLNEFRIGLENLNIGEHTFTAYLG